jgi:hypothetical protein
MNEREDSGPSTVLNFRDDKYFCGSKSMSTHMNKNAEIREGTLSGRSTGRAARAVRKHYVVAGFLLMCLALSVIFFVMQKAGQRQAGQEPAALVSPQVVTKDRPETSAAASKRVR